MFSHHNTFFRSLSFLVATVALSVTMQPLLFSQVLPLQYYSRKDGLISNGVSVLLQDSRGYLWIGSAEGISVYDGRAFKSYRTTDGLGHNFITSIVESRIHAGEMWVGTAGGGVSRISNNHVRTYLLDTLAEANNVTSMYEDSTGILWCGTPRGVYRIQNEAVSRFSLPGLDTSDVGVVGGTEHRTIFVMRTRLLIADPTMESKTIIDLRLHPSQSVTKVYTDGRKYLWVATNDSSLWQIADTSLIRMYKLPSGSVQDIADDREQGLWVCAEPWLLHVTYEGTHQGEIVRYGVENGLQSASLISCLVDREGNVWIGGAKGGLTKLAHKQLYRFPMDGVYSPANNSSAVVDRNRHWWIVSKNGLQEIFQSSPGSWRHYLHHLEQDASSRELHAVVLDDEGQLWVGFQDFKILCYKILPQGTEPSRLLLEKKFDADSRDGLNARRCFIVDRQNHLWSSHDGQGIVMRDGSGSKGILHRYGTKEHVPDGSIRTIFADRANNIWVGGYQAGAAVLRFDAQKKTYAQSFSSIRGLPDGHVRAIHQDKNGRMWIGTRDGGIVILEDSSMVVLSMNNGLISNTVWSLAEDGEGNIWAGTALGLQRINGHTLQPGPMTSEFFSNGLQSCGISGGELLWWVSSDEFTICTFTEKNVNAVPPPVYITRFLVNANEVDSHQRAELGYHQNICAFEFVGLSFVDERRVRYQYRLIGFDNNWSQPTAERSVTYAALQPGVYTFEVRALNSDGISSERSAVTTFIIYPPYWQTWWFRVLTLILLIALVAGVYNFRVSKLLEVERTRNRIARDLHDEVGTTLSSISYFAQAIQGEMGGRPASHGERFLSRIITSSYETQEAINDIIWSIDPSYDNWEKLLAKCQRYASDLFESRSIRYTIDFPKFITMKNLDMQKRRNFWLLFKEMVTNIVKHAQCSEATIHFSIEGRKAILTIHDNGVGFNASQAHHRHGMENIRKRASFLRAALALQTSPGTGTHWEMAFKI